MKAIDLLKEPRFVFAGLTSTLVYVIWGMLEACMALRYLDFGLSTESISLLMCIMPLVFAIMCVYLDQMIKNYEKRMVLIVATLGEIVC